MFIDSSKQIMQYGGGAAKPFIYKDDKSLTLCDVIVESLLGSYEGEKLSGAEQFARFDLARKFTDSTLPVKVSQSDASLIKDCIAKRWAHLIQVSGQAREMIDNAPNKLDETPVAQAAE